MTALCPDRAALARHLAGDRGFPADVTRHLDDCTDCQRELDRLTAPPPDAVTAAGRTPVDEPALRRLMGDLIRTGPAAPPAFALPLTPAADRPDLLGRFGPYDVVREIARGGMGVVLEAHDPVLRRAVAVKVLAPALAGHPQARARVLREARATSDIRHDHVLSPHAVEEHGGLPCLVLPLIRGRNLQEKLAAGPLPLADALRIGAEIADGLAAAHARGLVHRDLKPSNVLLDGPGERVKLADFGLARAADAADASLEGALCGTPRYMAPEQARGEPCSAAADLFALGSILHAMLAGRPPFEAPSVYGILRAVVEDQPPPLAPAVPADVRTLVRRLHAKNPADRPASAAQVAAELRAAAGGTRARPPRRRWVAGGLAALAAVVVAAAVLPGPPTAAPVPPPPTTGLQPPPAAGPEPPVIIASPPPAPIPPPAAGPQPPVIIAPPPPVAPPSVQRPILFVGHTGSPSRVAVTPDGRSVISVSGNNGDATIRVWDFATGKETRQFRLDGPYPATDVRIFPGFEANQWMCLSVSADGRRVATGSCGGLAVIWDFASGKEVARLLQPARVNQVQFSPDGQLLLSCSPDGQLFLWNVEPGTAALRAKWLAHPSVVRSIAFLPDGQTVLSTGYDKVVKAWDVATQREKYRCEGHTTWVQGLAVAKNGEWFLSGADDIRRWDAKTGKLLRNFNAPDMRGITSMALSPDQTFAATAAYDGTVRVWGIDSARELYRFNGQVSCVWDVTIAPDSQNLICTSGGHNGDKRAVWGPEEFALRRWLLPAPTAAPAVFAGPAGPVSALAVTPDGATVLSAGGAPTGGARVAAWGLSDGKLIRSFQPGAESDRPASVAASPDGRLALTATAGGAGVLSDVATGREVRRLAGHPGGMTAAAFSPDGTRAVTAGGDKTVRVWDVATADEVRRWTAGTAVSGLAVAGDGSAVVAAGEDGTFTVWNLASGEKAAAWKTPGPAGGHRVALTPDGKQVVSARGRVFVWETGTGKLLKTLDHFANDALTVAVSPDGRRAASGGADGRVYVWQLAAGELAVTLAEHTGPVRAVAFSPTGRYLLTAGGAPPAGDYAIRRFDLLPIDTRANRK
ncbi:serine/threonine protein kinase [bacterium]|nr:serine/threonine protein kinase [bacterium]